MNLNDGWKMKDFDLQQERDSAISAPDFPDYFWLNASVPGDVHSNLKDRGIIDDPFFGHNDLKCKWIEEKVWWYRNTFDFHEKLTEDDFLELCFNGLDTFATVFLNGKTLGTTDNMFVAHTFDVTREIRQGTNVLAVKFDPIHEKVKDREILDWTPYSRDRVWTRKAQAHFGWDWGPRLVSVGIWQEVTLKKHHIAKIDHVYVRTKSIADEEAVVEVSAEVSKHRGKDLTLEYHVTFNGEPVQAMVSKDIARYQSIITIPEPKLWWTHDLGKPHLYILTAILKDGERVIDSRKEEIGIRTIELQQKDAFGEDSFTFVLNGRKVFAKGCNWIPIDSFIGSAPESRYHSLIEMAKEANMNMLRVWGGGIYEKEIFYRNCDRMGIMVWQDFMFSCALYPDYHQDFMKNVKNEIIEIVKRIRNHPSLALWCGNNENDWLYEILKTSGEITSPFYGEKIYHDLIPGVLDEWDPSRFYWPSSPYGGNDHDSEAVGDRHNWQVWHGNIEPRKFGELPDVDYSIQGVSFKNYKKDHTKFSSEFGMHASANRYTLKNHIPTDGFYWNSTEMAYRNKDIHHEKGMLLMEGYTGLPENIDDYIHYSMLTQAEGLKYGVEHYRRNKYMTSGTLIWQLNDCWPGTSWSLIDYEGLPKASYYYAKRFFAPVLLTADIDSDEDFVHIYVVNDLLSDYEDTLIVMLYGLDGEVIDKQSIPVQARKNASTKVGAVDKQQWTVKYPQEKIYLRLISESGKAPTNQYYLVDHKDLQLEPSQVEYQVNEEETRLRLKALALRE